MDEEFAEVGGNILLIYVVVFSMDGVLALMEVFFLSPFKGERPPPAPEHRLGIDEPWTNAPELGMLGKVFDQDMFNMPKVQLGLETSFKPGITLGNYQESKIRWLHHLIGQFVEGEPVSIGNREGAET